MCKRISGFLKVVSTPVFFTTPGETFGKPIIHFPSPHMFSWYTCWFQSCSCDRFNPRFTGRVTRWFSRWRYSADPQYDEFQIPACSGLSTLRLILQSSILKSLPFYWRQPNSNEPIFTYLCTMYSVFHLCIQQGSELRKVNWRILTSQRYIHFSLAFIELMLSFPPVNRDSPSFEYATKERISFIAST